LSPEPAIADIIALLPPLLAALNLTAASLAGLAFYFGHKRNHTAHGILMTLALLVSVLFLSIYAYYHYRVGNVPFSGQGIIRPLYFSILISHVILATLMVPMILTTLSRALRRRFDSHRRIARWTLPVWIYVSVTGVLIYVLAFQVYPPILDHMG